MSNDDDEPRGRTVIIDKPASDRDIIARSKLGMPRFRDPLALALLIATGRPEVVEMPVVIAAPPPPKPVRIHADERTIRMGFANGPPTSTASTGHNDSPMTTMTKHGLVAFRRTKESKAARRMERRNRRLHRR